jgi:antitoxin (DNA-binding transcriptional repressor) of toxin-antitoxin stability system
VECDAIMCHMKSMSIRDLRYRFPQVEAHLREGEAIAITKRKRVIARLVPERPVARKAPDFMAMLKRIYGNKKTKVTGAELVAMQRGEY